MTMIDKKLFRAAVAIQEQVSRQGPAQVTIRLPEYYWNRVKQINRNIARARERGWHLAAQSLFGELADAGRSLGREVNEALGGLVRRTEPRLPASLSTIYLDLRALIHEFEEVEVDLHTHELAVTTDTIELDEVVLGAFQIRLKWSDIGQTAPPYRIVALDPHPAARRDDVTHPHVQDERLCEGDGHTAIDAALAGSRFHDFFLLVNRLLHTYGRGHAYIEIEDWDGTPCADCGTCIDDDERCCCNGCDSILCDSCSLSCHRCDSSFCAECLRPCEDCGNDFCSNCLETCSVCRKHFCADCRDDGMCADCYQKLHPKEPENDSSHESPCEVACLAGQGS